MQYFVAQRSELTSFFKNAFKYAVHIDMFSVRFFLGCMVQIVIYVRSVITEIISLICLSGRGLLAS